MQCPRCSASLKELSNHNIQVDVCYEGCGGIWFDPFEFKKMDEKHEADEAFLTQLSQSSNKHVDLSGKINCPACEAQPMYRRFFSVKKSVELDECPKCAGFWLDAGELTHIYSTFKTEAEKNAAAQELFGEMFGAELEAMKEESEASAERVRKVTNALRFICPSYYIKGKQDWGAF